jgi:polar amino acid transport system substrate-binding protein
MTRRPERLLSVVVLMAIVLTGCGRSGGAPTQTSAATPTAATQTAVPLTPAPAASPTAAVTHPPATPATTPPPASATPVAGDPNDLLAVIKARGTIRMSTDPQYPPQSALDPATGEYVGFDIDVGTEIAKRLGVEIAFETPAWEVLTAGSWAGRWDFSVGSMTITSGRQAILDFTQPYYFTPAQMAARKDTGITTLEGLAGKTICVGAGTTYLDWLNGTLDFGTESPQTTPPDGAVATTLSTDRKCPEAWQRGRKDADGWLSSSTTVQAAIKDGLPVVAVGDPVFHEPLAVAIDKSGAPHAELLAELDRIVGEMHADGTLSAMSLKWFDLDLTQKSSE